MGDQVHHVFTNGKVFLPVARDSSVSALNQTPVFADCLLIRGDKIEYAGPESAEEVASARASGATVHDLGGRTVLPGFVDGHMHLMLMGQSLIKVDLGHCKTLEDIRETIRSYGKTAP